MGSDETKTGQYKHRGTVMLLIALVFTWCFIGISVKRWQLDAYASDYSHAKNAVHNKELLETVDAQDFVTAAEEFTADYERANRRTFVTASWDVFILYQSHKNTNLIGEIESQRLTTKKVEQGKAKKP